MAGAKAPHFAICYAALKGRSSTVALRTSMLRTIALRAKNIAGEAQSPGDFLRATIRKIDTAKRKATLAGRLCSFNSVYSTIFSFHSLFIRVSELEFRRLERLVFRSWSAGVGLRGGHI